MQYIIYVCACVYVYMHAPMYINQSFSCLRKLFFFLVVVAVTTL